METKMEVLFKRLSKKYWDRVDDIQEDPNLISGCKYMLYWSDQYEDLDGEVGGCIPVVNMEEAREFIKDLKHI